MSSPQPPVGSPVDPGGRVDIVGRGSSNGGAPALPDEPAGNEVAQRSYRQILSQEMAAARQEFERPSLGLFMSALSAGLDIGFGPFLMAVFLTMSDDALSEPVTRLVIAGLYSIGFLVVILGRSELFTEHTTMAVLPVLSRRARPAALGRVWGLVLAGNLLGASVFAFVASLVGRELGVIEARALEEIAQTLVQHSWWVILFSAVLAGWLMGLVSWLVVAARETISQIVIIVVVTGAIGLATLHHSIAGTVEVLFGVIAGATGLGDLGTFLVWSIVGNALGGSVFVALLKYAHVVRSVPDPDEPAS